MVENPLVSFLLSSDIDRRNTGFSLVRCRRFGKDAEKFFCFRITRHCKSKKACSSSDSQDGYMELDRLLEMGGSGFLVFLGLQKSRRRATPQKEIRTLISCWFVETTVQVFCHGGPLLQSLHRQPPISLP